MNLGATLVCLIGYPLAVIPIAGFGWLARRIIEGKDPEDPFWAKPRVVVLLAAMVLMFGLGMLNVWAHGWWVL